MLIRKIKPFVADIQAEPDKSITHRALILGAAAEGITKIYRPSLCADCLSTVDCLQKLGANVSFDEKIISVSGGIKRGEYNLFAGNSGTTLRLLSGLIAGKNGTTAIIDGDDSLRKRPLKRVTEPLSGMGADISFIGKDDSLPVRINGKQLSGIEYSLPVSSAQLKSALLLAGLRAYSRTVLDGKINSRNHTELMLSAMGADIRYDSGKIALEPSLLRATEFEPCGDFSSAAYFIALALLTPDSEITIRNVNVNPTRIAALELLKSCGADICLFNMRQGVEPFADVYAKFSKLSPFAITAETVPFLVDEIPLLTVVACFIEGQSTIRGAEELKNKESNRINAIADGLKRMGADMQVLDDGLCINGRGRLRGGCRVSGFGDHRIEMSLAIAAATSETGAEIDGGSVCVSFPSFYKIFCEIGAEVRT